MDIVWLVCLLVVAWCGMGALGWMLVCMRFGYEGSRDLRMLPICLLVGPVALWLATRS